MSAIEQAEDERILSEGRRRKNKLLILLLLLLFLLFFLAALFAYFFFVAPAQPVKKGKFEVLFSIYGLSRPMASAVDKNKNIYVSNNGSSEVYIFNDQGDYKEAIGSPSKTTKAKNRVYAIYGVHVEGQKILVADFTARKVHIFSLKGKALDYFPKYPNAKKYGPNGFTPFGIAAYKGKFYVTSNDGIYIFSKSGKLLDNWSGHGLKQDQFDYPNGITIDQSDGTIFVTDVLNRRVKALNNDGSIKWIIGRPHAKGKVKSLFLLPRGIAFDKEREYVYVVDTFADKIFILDKEGRLISSVGERGTDEGQFNFPEGITFIGNDTFYITDRENSRLQALRLTEFTRPDKDVIDKYRESFLKGKPKKAGKR